MSPNSNTSSMEAHNGSAYSGANNAATRSTTEGRNTSHVQYSYSSAHTYNRREQAQPSTGTHQATSSHYGPYDFPTYDHRSTPRYANELAFEDDPAPTASARNPAQNGHTGESRTAGQEHLDAHANAAHSPTTQRWTAERSPEERLRLGLPRYATPEEQRRANQEVVNYEARRRNGGFRYSDELRYEGA